MSFDYRPIVADGYGSFPMGRVVRRTVLGFRLSANQRGLTCMIPYWFLTLSTGGLAAILWPRWARRFSLRALLIAAPLVAIALALIVWFAQLR